VAVVTFTTLADVSAAARAALAPHVWDYIEGGSGSEAAIRRNRNALDRLSVVPRVLRDVTDRNPSTTFLGIPLALPVMIAPIGGIAHAHPDGAVGLAAAAQAMGTTAWISTAAAPGLEEVAAACPGPLVFQLYVAGTREATAGLVRRALESGYRAVCLTVDTHVSARRDRDIQHGFDPKERALPNTGKAITGGFRQALSWSDVAWLRQMVDVPLVLKGILAPEDARMAVEHGVDAVVVSNHGGRQFDGAPAAVEMLSDVVHAVAGSAAVVVDGGVGSGTDVLRALALGADAVLIGRLACRALAAGGASGVQRVLELLAEEVSIGMGLLGVTRPEEVRSLQVRIDR
jgi:isopentenyl diphosphate isomerase/L-lactate dehydrogenase-like FMN-dependent dehydrogenase